MTREGRGGWAAMPLVAVIVWHVDLRGSVDEFSPPAEVPVAPGHRSIHSRCACAYSEVIKIGSCFTIDSEPPVG